MSKDDAEKQRNEEILRAEDIIPPYNKKNAKQEKEAAGIEASKPIGDKVKRQESLSTKNEDTVQQKVKIPKFDLANQIMSEHRKVATIKRKRPDPKNKATSQKKKAPSTDYTHKQPLILSQQEKIIAEIVAEDIHKLRKGNNLNT